MKNVIEMTSKEMIAEYNSLTGKNITKFSTRAVGEKQLEKARSKFVAELKNVREELVAEVEKAAEPVAKEYHYSVDGCPSCGAKEDITPAGLEGTAGGERLFCHNCSTEFHQDGRIYNAPAKSKTLSESIKASWKNAEVAAKRAKRDHVEVEGKGVFPSVLKAFQALGLPVSKHIKFRMELKAQGSAKFGSYNFKIVK